MSTQFSIFFLSAASLIFAILLSPVVHAEANEVIATELTFEAKLKNLQTTLQDKEIEKRQLERELKRETDTLTKEQLQQELVAANDIILGLREEIVNLATGGSSLYEEPPQVKTEFDWRKDLELIFEPILQQLREISDRPRMIEKLEADIEYWQGREQQLNLAVENITANIANVKSKALKRTLNELLDSAVSRSNTAQQKLSLLRNELALQKQAKSPVWKTLKDIFTKIIAVAILHFLLALIAALLIFQLVRLLAIIAGKLIAKDKTEKTELALRTINIVRIMLGAVLAVITYFIVLYGFAEWLLLVLSLLVIAAIMLALRNTLPQYIIEIKTLLNLGSIRQGERIILHGLPWQINRLNVHTRLYNPALEGYLRVPLTQIVEHSSRPYHKDEPWFPSNAGDVVMLDDGTFGRIKRQTPDMIEIIFRDSIFSYQTADFLSKRIQNLSREGFAVQETFGFDYQHQSEITTTILATYKQAIEAAIKSSVYGEYNTSLLVEFENASASSLDFKIIAAFDGEIAAKYFKIKRFLQTTSVEVANQHGWVIPFQQITVHHQAIDS